MAEDKKTNIHERHRERMRKKFHEIGFKGWSKYEVLEYMLYHVFAQGDTNPKAHSLIDYGAGKMSQMFKNIEDEKSVNDIDGIGDKTIAYLRHLKAFVDYYRNEELSENPTTLTRENFREVLKMADMSDECEDIVLICLDSKLNIKSVMKITEYSDESSAIASINQIIKRASRTESSNVVLIHNHPSGNTEISVEDRRMTEQLDERLRAVDIFLVDHYIVCGDEIVSVKMSSKED